MKIRRLFIGLVFLCVFLEELPSVRADNIYRINTRAYRHMMATQSRAYRNMMHTKYPSQFGQDLRGFVNNSLLQPNGPVEQLIKGLLLGVAAGGSQDDSDGTLVAKTEASDNADLTATLGKTREILKTLKVDEPPKVTTTVPTTPTISRIKDFSHFEDTVP